MPNWVHHYLRSSSSYFQNFIDLIWVSIIFFLCLYTVPKSPTRRWDSLIVFNHPWRSTQLNPFRVPQHSVPLPTPGFRGLAVVLPLLLVVFWSHEHRLYSLIFYFTPNPGTRGYPKVFHSIHSSSEAMSSWILLEWWYSKHRVQDGRKKADSVWMALEMSHYEWQGHCMMRHKPTFSHT